MSELQLTQAQQIDPLLNSAAGANSFANTEIPRMPLGAMGKVGARLLLAVGLPISAVAADSFSSEQVAYADHICSEWEADYSVLIPNPDGSNTKVPQYWCYDNPPPVTTAPPVTSPNPTQTTTPRTNPPVTAPPIVYVQLDHDGDTYQQTARQDTGEIVNTGFEVDDNSAGEGESGLAKLKAEFEARGLSFDANPDNVGFYTLVGLTVNPADFSKYIELLASTPLTTTTIETTTTTTTIPESTTTEKTTTTTIPESTTTEKTTADTTEPVANGTGTKGSGPSGSKVSATEIISVGGIVALIAASGLGMFFATRRHRYNRHSHAA